MKFATARNHPERELKDAAAWYAAALGSGQLESWKRAGLALDEFGRVESQTIAPVIPTCTHWGVSAPRTTGLWVLCCPRCGRKDLTPESIAADREFFRDCQNAKERVSENYEEENPALVWQQLFIESLPFRKGPVPDIPFVMPRGSTISKKRAKRISDTKEEVYLAFDPTDPATQKDIWLTVMQARWRSWWWRGLPANMRARFDSMMPRDGGLKKMAFIVELRNNGFMVADGRRWKWVKRAIRKTVPGLPEDIKQLRIRGLTYQEIARRLGMLESQIRLLVRKTSARQSAAASSTSARSMAISRKMDSSNCSSDINHLEAK